MGLQAASASRSNRRNVLPTIADKVPVDLEGNAGRPTDPQREEDGHDGVLDQHDNSPLTTPPASQEHSMPEYTNDKREGKTIS